MSTLLVALISLAVAFGVGFVRGWRRTTDTDRWERERAEWEQRHAQRRRDDVLSRAGRFYPYLKDRFKAAHTTDSPAEQIRAVLADVPGTTVGSGPSDLPVVIADECRTRHIAIFGRSGTGKTSLMLRLLDDDLRRGHGVIVLAAEEEVARDLVLPRCTARDTIYLAPGHNCPVAWNPLEVEHGEDPSRWSAEVYLALREAVGENGIGPRSDALARHLFSALVVGLPDATFLDVRRFLHDKAFRERVLATVADEQVRAFWTDSYPKYPENAILPLLQRTDRFTTPNVRRTLCQPRSSFSLREALDRSKVMIVDLSNLDPDTTALLGQLVLARLGLEVFRRERMPEEERPFTAVYADEFALFAGAGSSWSSLLARARRYRIGLIIGCQFPAQVPLEVRREILGNTSCLVCFAVSAENAAVLRRELIVPSGNSGPTAQVSGDTLVTLPVGRAYVRLATGSLAMPVRVLPPLAKLPIEDGKRVRAGSWERYGARPLHTSRTDAASPAGSGQPDATTAAQVLPGRGGAVHKELQRLACTFGERAGFRAMTEQDILGGTGRVDVALVRDGVRIGVEVAVTSTPEQVASAVTKALAAGFTHVVVLSHEPELLRRIEALVVPQLVAKDHPRVRCLDPERFRAFLTSLAVPVDGRSRTAGYHLKVLVEGVAPASVQARRHTLARLAGTALLRSRVRT